MRKAGPGWARLGHPMSPLLPILSLTVLTVLVVSNRKKDD